MFSDGDDNQGIVLGVLFGVIALVIGLVIGLGIYKTRMPRLAAPVDAVVLVPAMGAGVLAVPPALRTQPAPVSGVAIEVSAIKILFEPRQVTLPAGAMQALPGVAAQAAAGRTLVVSGFVEAGGDLARNEVLARERVLAVRNALTALGVPPQKILLAMPSALSAVGSEADSRRVDVRVQ